MQKTGVGQTGGEWIGNREIGSRKTENGGGGGFFLWRRSLLTHEDAGSKVAAASSSSKYNICSRMRATGRIGGQKHRAAAMSRNSTDLSVWAPVSCGSPAAIILRSPHRTRTTAAPFCPLRCPPPIPNFTVGNIYAKQSAFIQCRNFFRRFSTADFVLMPVMTGFLQGDGGKLGGNCETFPSTLGIIPGFPRKWRNIPVEKLKTQ